MALGDDTSNDIPLGVGYDANGNAKSFVELSAINVTNVSATQYWGLPAGSDGTLSGLSDTRVSSTGARAPLHGESLVYSAGYWAPSAVIAGGGGGGTSLPNGVGGDILSWSDIDGGGFWYPSSTSNLGIATTAALEATNTNLAATAAYATNTFATITNLAATAAYATNTFATTAALNTTNSNFTTFINTTAPAVYATTAALAASAISVAAAYQPLDSDLTSIAGLTVAAGSIIYATAANTYAVLLRPSGSGVYTLKIDMGNARIPIWVLDPSP